MTSYVATIRLRRRILEESHTPDQTLHATLVDPTHGVTSDPVYMQIRVAKGQYTHLHLQRMYRHRPEWAMLSLSDIAYQLTNLQIDQFRVTLPMKDQLTLRYPRRIEALDATSLPGLKIGFTDVKTPGIVSNPAYRFRHDDLILSDPKRDLSQCLVSVNGVFHPVVGFNGDALVRDGFYNIRNCKDVKIGIYDTTSIGGCSAYPIRAGDILNAPDEDTRKSVYLRVPSMKGKTPFLVLNGYLHPLDGTYEVINDTTLKIHTNRIDYIHEYLHSPNTTFLHDASGRLLKNPFRDEQQPLTTPTDTDILRFFMRNMYPIFDADKSGKNTFVGDIYMTERAPNQPTDEEALYHFLTNMLPMIEGDTSGANTFLGNIVREMDPYGYLPPKQQLISTQSDLWPFLDTMPLREYVNVYGPREISTQELLTYMVTEVIPAMINHQDAAAQFAIDVHRPDYLKHFMGIYPTIPWFILSSELFLRKILLSPISQVILLNTDQLYMRTYPMVPHQEQRAYYTWSEDTPRGFLWYNREKIIPYLTTTAVDTDLQMVRTDFLHRHNDLYKTARDHDSVPSPMFDQIDDTRTGSVELLEFYTA